MRSDLVVTTTSNLEGSEIQAYLGPVFSHVVAGTGLFSDIFAALSDVFGGRSRSYQKQLAAINEEAIELLKEKAARLGANCILSLRLDHDEISGGAKSMFMVTGSGTAVRTASAVPPTSDKVSAIPFEEVNRTIRRLDIIDRVQSGKYRLDGSTWKFLIDNSVFEVADAVIDTVVDTRALRAEENLERAKAYFESLPPQQVKAKLYRVVTTSDSSAAKSFALDTLAGLNLPDFDVAESLLDSDDFEIRKRALPILRMDKDTYSPQDTARIEILLTMVESRFAKRSREINVDSMFSSKAKRKWECECGTTMPSDSPRCHKCYKDMYGFGEDELLPSTVTALLSKRLSVLRWVFRNEAN